MARLSRRIALLMSIVALSATTTVAQISSTTSGPRVLHLTPDSPVPLQTWDAEVNRLTADQELVLTAVHIDSLMPDRHHENFRQFFRGVPVQGGGLTRQVLNGSTVSIIGTMYRDIDVDTNPGLSGNDAVSALRQRTAAEPAFGQAPSLVVLPKLLRGYALAYRITMTDETTYFIDAQSGSLLQILPERREQGEVGVGTGALGDVKKISTTFLDGSYRTEDTLRPAGIHTFDTRLSAAALERMISQGQAFDSDFATDSDNMWTDSRIVDAHVHAGWAHDYFSQRHNWRGIDGIGTRIVSIVHRLLANNAFFTPPPFGPGRIGAVVFGDTSAGRPLAALDLVAHEIMHGVTHYGLLRRTGEGLGGALYVDRLGPTSFTTGGTTYPCARSVLVFSDGRRLPFLCDGERYILVSNHPGDINEAFSDVFGTSAEFFLIRGGQSPDYSLAEDVQGFGPVRRLDNPGALDIPTSGGPLPYPDHVSRRLNFAVVLVEGTQSDPVLVDIAPIAFVGDAAFLTAGDNQGGVHWNSTVLSHAFYLAIEGGRNQTSSIAVQGVGSQNRAEIERAFFRAMTELMPASPNLAIAAAAIRQSAEDLFGETSGFARAVSDALTAVGLPR